MLSRDKVIITLQSAVRFFHFSQMMAWIIMRQTKQQKQYWKHFNNRTFMIESACILENMKPASWSINGLCDCVEVFSWLREHWLECTCRYSVCGCSTTNLSFNVITSENVLKSSILSDILFVLIQCIQRSFLSAIFLLLNLKVEMNTFCSFAGLQISDLWVWNIQTVYFLETFHFPQWARVMSFYYPVGAQCWPCQGWLLWIYCANLSRIQILQERCPMKGDMGYATFF